MNMGSRVRAERIAQGLTQKELAKRCGAPLTQTTIQSIEDRGSRASKHAAAIARGLAVRVEWLVTGDEPKHDNKSPIEGTDPADKYEFATRVYGAVLSAGNGSTHWEHEEIDGSHAFTRAWLQRKRLNIKSCRVLSVQGDSMLPQLQDGNVVLIDLSDCAPIKSGKVYALSVDGEQRIKRLFPQIDGSLRITSDNPDKSLYPDELVRPEFLDRVRIIGRKRWHAGDDD